MRVKRSAILNHFEVNSNIATCKMCKTTMKSDRTNNLKTHLVKIHKTIFTENDRKTIAAKTFEVQLTKEERIKSQRPSIYISDDTRFAELSEDSKPTADFAYINTSLSSLDLPSTSVITAHPPSPPKKLKLHTPTSIQKPLENSQTISGTPNQPSLIDENEYDCFGKSIGCQLKMLPESVAQQSMACIQTYLVKKRLKVIERSLENKRESSDDPIQ